MAPAILLALILTGFALRANEGIGQAAFGDESGHLIGAHAILAGDRLYRDFIDAHGPVAFMVPWLYDAVFGWSHANGVRWTMVGFAAVAVAAVGSSGLAGGGPANRRRAGLWAAALFASPVASVWTVQALCLVSYHTMAGTFTVVSLAVFVMPAVLGRPVGRWRSVIAGGCGLLCCASAYPLVPSVILLGGGPILAVSGVAGHVRRAALGWLAGFAGAGALLLVWMLLHGDLVGYVVFHFLTLQANYARYAPVTAGLFVRSLIPSTAPVSVVHAMALGACVVGAVAAAPLLGRAWRRWAGLAVTLSGVLLLDARGLVTFQDGTFVMAAFAFAALPLGALLAEGTPTAQAALGTAMLAAGCLGLIEHTARTAISSPWGMTRAAVLAAPPVSLAVDPTDPMLIAMRGATRPGERILSLVYSPTIFLQAGLLPVRGFHEYLPWEADYAAHPIWGRARDICTVLLREPPPAMWYDGWAVMGLYRPEQFIPCLRNVLATRYVHDVRNAQLHIRLDRVAQAQAAGFIPAAP